MWKKMQRLTIHTKKEWKVKEKIKTEEEKKWTDAIQRTRKKRSRKGKNNLELKVDKYNASTFTQTKERKEKE